MPKGDKNSPLGLFERNSSSRAFCLFDLNPARLGLQLLITSAMAFKEKQIFCQILQNELQFAT
jgi:hypothetical protein